MSLSGIDIDHRASPLAGWKVQGIQEFVSDRTNASTIACWFAGAFLSRQRQTPPPLDRVSMMLGNVSAL